MTLAALTIGRPCPLCDGAAAAGGRRAPAATAALVLGPLLSMPALCSPERSVGRRQLAPNPKLAARGHLAGGSPANWMLLEQVRQLLQRCQRQLGRRPPVGPDGQAGGQGD